MNATRELVLSSMAGLLVASCSSSTTAPGSPDAGQDAAGAPMSLAEFCSGLFAATAQLLNRCLGGAESTWAAEVPAQYSCASLASAVAAGRVVYDPTGAAKCLAGYPTLSCSDLLVGPTACFGPLRGTVDDGGTCLTDGDCGPSSFCSGVGNGSASCQGKCAPLIPAGGPCLSTEECVVGYTCAGNSGSLSCISDRHPLAKVGESCAPVAVTKPSIWCASGLRCDLQTLRCATTAAKSDSCTPGEGLCETFTFCDAASHACKPDPGKGGVCGSTPGGEYVSCLPGLFCDFPSSTSPTGTCVPLGAGGATCTRGSDCASGSCSRASGKGTCSAPCTEE